MNPRHLPLVAAVALALIAGACNDEDTGPTTAPSPESAAAPEGVARIIDGDTIEMASGATVRLIGVDTPERGDCGYDEATAALAGLVADQPVTLAAGTQDDTDRHGRQLRYVILADGRDAGEELLAAGWASARYNSRDGYGPHPREGDYLSLDVAVPNQCAGPPAPEPSTTTAPPAVAEPAEPASPSYGSCAEARSAGAAPLHRGEPGYTGDLDRDGDGVACE